MSDLESIDWNEASRLGLIEKINRLVLHPLGLAMTRNPDTGVSDCLLVSGDGKFEYSPKMKTSILSDDEVRAAIKSRLPKPHKKMTRAL